MQSGVIPVPLNFDRCEPVSVGEWFDASRFVDQPVPSLADSIEYVVIVRPDAVRKIAFFEMEPDPLDDVKFWRIGRQKDQGCVS